MIPSLDEVKARADKADFADLDTELLRQSSADVPRLVAALEAVLALGRADDAYPTAFEKGYDLAIEDVREAIERALEEGKQ